jgi:ABC-type transport system substrate-binding protein
LGLAVAGAPLLAATAADVPKRGGTLTYLIPADAPPSFDAHRETTYATRHTAAPFYSVLIRINPDNPSSTTDFVCDLCTEMPSPTDGGRTYTFKIRQDVKFHDGTPLTAYDVAASWRKIIRPPEGLTSARVPDPTTVVFRLKFATNAFLPALADPYTWIYKKDILDKDPRWYEKNVMGSESMRTGNFEVVVDGSCNSVVNPLIDVQKYLPHDVFPENYGQYEDKEATDIYNKMLQESDAAKQRALMRAFEKRVLDTEAHEMVMTYWNRIVPLRSYVKGWKISPSHYLNQDLANVWLDQ